MKGVAGRVQGPPGMEQKAEPIAATERAITVINSVRMELNASINKGKG